MGRRKQKVRWTSVEEGFFESQLNEDGETAVMVVDEPQADVEYDDNRMTTSAGDHSETSSVSHRHNSGGHYHHQNSHSYHRKSYYGPPRRYGPGWNNGPVAPRFERKAAAEGRGYYGHDFVHDSEEHLPNGFTKIRSKNLDVLFKKDYYAQRAHLSSSQTSSTAVSSEHGDDDDVTDDRNLAGKKNSTFEEVEEEETSTTIAATATNEAEAVERETEAEVDNQTEEACEAKNAEGEAEDVDVDVEDDKKEGEEGQSKKSVINGQASPFYPSGYLSPSPPIYVSQHQASRPNLFLYSPTSNTMIPCEEIVIPNPVVGPEGSTLYQGPSNIYLAFPCDNSGMTSPGALGPHPGYPPYMGPAAMPAGPLVHYDQYGVPYTSYQQQPQPVSTSSVASGSSPPSADIEDHSITYTSETGTEPSSAESTTPHSPPDLSAYSPANWADVNSFVPHNGYTQQQQQQWYPQPHHYYGPPHHKRHYYSRQSSYHNSYNNQFHHHHHRPSSGYNSDRATACLPSSGGDSLAEEEEDLRPVDNELNTVDESADKQTIEKAQPSKQQLQQQQQQAQQQPQRVFIPGLPERLAAAAAVANGKRVQKKRRKKKTAGSSQNATSGQEPQSVRSSSLKSEQSLVLPSTLSSSEEDLRQVVANEEEKIEAVEVTETYAEVAASREKEAGEEETQAEPEPEVEEVTETGHVVEPEPEPAEQEREDQREEAEEDGSATTVTAAPNAPVTKPRRRRGKRSGQQQSEKQLRSAQLRQAEERASEAVKVENAVESPPEVQGETEEANGELSKNEDEWESVPPELKLASTADQWETSSRSRRSRKGGRLPQQVAQPEEEELVIVDEIPSPSPPVKEKTPEPVQEPVEPVSEPVQAAAEQAVESEDASERSSSAPASRRSTLKKQNRKKRPSLDDGKSTGSSGSGSTIRPVLIQDGMIDIMAGGLLTIRPLLKRPTDILDEQALMIKDIGHGMREGPITMGRFGIGKYTPPDRSDEILSSIVARQIKLDEVEEKAAVEAVTAEAAGNSSQDLDLD